MSDFRETDGRTEAAVSSVAIVIAEAGLEKRRLNGNYGRVEGKALQASMLLVTGTDDSSNVRWLRERARFTCTRAPLPYFASVLAYVFSLCFDVDVCTLRVTVCANGVCMQLVRIAW